MLHKFQNIQKHLKENIIQTRKEKLGKTIQEYDFLYISDNINDDQNLSISKNINKSRLMAIDYFEDPNSKTKDLHFIIVFNKMIIIIKHTSSTLSQLFSSIKQYNSEIEIYFLPNAKNIFYENISFKFKESSSITNKYYDESKNVKFFNEELDNIKKNLIFKKSNISTSSNELSQIWKSIIPCLSSYLLKQSYNKLIKIDRINDFKLTKHQPIQTRIFDEEDLNKLELVQS